MTRPVPDVVPGGTGALVRCDWAEANDLLRTYHDREWGQPVTQSRALWEALVLETFQAGLSWNTVLQKRENFRAAFCGFDPHRVAAFTPDDQARLMENAGIIRSRAKIAATIANAQAWLAMHNAGEDFAAFAWGMVHAAQAHERGTGLEAQTPLSGRVAKALKHKGFRFVGSTTAQAWMQAVGMLDGHEAACFCYRGASSRP
ncbi:DNA-3-methyladenine glycosylase I [Acetobacter okinawensis]|uniref:DNA-3-methyladenine glycosylase I n=1 Tax=Acetobacter okinawensis TaxID=1076594 RepID=UPI0039E9DDBE